MQIVLRYPYEKHNTKHTNRMIPHASNMFCINSRIIQI